MHVLAKTLKLNLLFHLVASQYCISYGAFKPLNRFCALANDFSDRIDFFNQSKLI